jgi:uncharacterized membrane protein YhdT
MDKNATLAVGLTLASIIAWYVIYSLVTESCKYSGMKPSEWGWTAWVLHAMILAVIAYCGKKVYAHYSVKPFLPVFKQDVASVGEGLAKLPKNFPRLSPQSQRENSDVTQGGIANPFAAI